MREPTTLIGFGEAARTFSTAGDWSGFATVFDIDPARAAAAEQIKLASAPDARTALDGAKLVLCLVTADQALAAARDYAQYLSPGALWLDMNSVAPQTKRAAAEHISAVGAHYVDAAILAPVSPACLNVPVLLAGPEAEAARAALAALGFARLRVIGEEIGRASAIKMIRSVMVKGIEALCDEMMQAAEAAGVADEVLASLDASDKTQSWAERVAYNRERMETHGLRRAAEMEESAATLRALSVEPLMTDGTVQRQRAAALRGGPKRDAA